ncbi:MAG TPA: hypothetical protein VN441_14020 [Syntrophomonas sp.]|nr:hypothetical protein [Syntrophomonas sp.]
MSGSFMIEMNGITKSFPGVVANDAITFAVRVGEIHALLGENGAVGIRVSRVRYFCTIMGGAYLSLPMRLPGRKT